jgi:hypothetical protein
MHLLRDPCSNELRAGLDLSASECKYRRLWHGAASPVPVHPYRVNAKSAEFQESNMMPIEALQCVSAWSCIPPRPSTGGRELRTYPPGEVPARFPPSDAPDLSCAENGRSYVQQSSRVKVSLRPDQFPPTGWPCSIKAPEPPRDSQGSGQPYRAPRMSAKRVGTLASLVP